ncbi:hypothetical protein [Nocardia sp. NPDC050175]|uniref:hypothetical protein n=1 Tax=Nocardia sp. NPDC050175 TaxID=3364317 RepID=UPI003791FBD6
MVYASGTCAETAARLDAHFGRLARRPEGHQAYWGFLGATTITLMRVATTD